MLLDCRRVSKSFGTNEILRDVSLCVNDGEKVALVGVNGCGKTTLLKIITGEYTCDSGSVLLADSAAVGYLSQHPDIDGSETLYGFVLSAKRDVIEIEGELRQLEKQIDSEGGDALEALMERYGRLTAEFEQKNGYAYKSEVTGVLKGLGFCEEEFSKSVSSLSGGERTRAALGRVLLCAPRLLILDEPTNHLDMQSVDWLENRLTAYRGAVLVVSHDRYFLDRIVTHVVEIENHASVSFQGNYTEFSRKKAQARSAMYNAYIKQRQEIKRQEAIIRKLKSFNREKSIKRAESREKLLARTELIEKPDAPNADIRLSLAPDIESGSDVLFAEGITKAFGSHVLYDPVTLEVHKGERVAVIGANGTGKTTLLKIITGLVRADGGTVRTGSNVHIGYYDQEQQVFDDEKTIFEEISDSYPRLTETRIRNVCAAFLFTGDDVFSKIKNLSGGEKGRLALAKLMLSKANFLILDEPTNHLDMNSCAILEDALNSYSGTVLFVSHDRYFINRTATRIIEIYNKQLINYTGDYDYYLEKRDELRTRLAGNAAATDEAVRQKNETEAFRDWRAQKEAEAARRKRENDIKKAEDGISELEDEIKEINGEINLPENANDHVALTALTARLEDAQRRLDELLELWERLS